MLPLSLLHSENCTLRDFSIDFANPHISQVKIVKNEREKGITFEAAPWVKYRISKEKGFESYGEGWTGRPQTGIAFEGQTKRLVYRTSDLSIDTREAEELSAEWFMRRNGKTDVSYRALW